MCTFATLKYQMLASVMPTQAWSRLSAYAFVVRKLLLDAGGECLGLLDLHFVQHPSARIYENKFSCIAHLVGVCPSSWSRQRSVVPHEAVQEPGEFSLFWAFPTGVGRAIF